MGAEIIQMAVDFSLESIATRGSGTVFFSNVRSKELAIQNSVFRKNIVLFGNRGGIETILVS